MVLSVRNAEIANDEGGGVIIRKDDVVEKHDVRFLWVSNLA